MLDFDAYAVGSEAGQPSNSDVYAFRFNPLRVYRITKDKRVSTMSAKEGQIVVAAADDQVDQLGRVLPDGSIAPVDGLGRPHAFNPELLPDGTVRFEDNNGGGANDSRYLQWDPRTGRQTVLAQAPTTDYIGFGAGPEGRFYHVFEDASDDRGIKILGGDRDRAYPLPAGAGFTAWGTEFIAVGLRKETGASVIPAVGTLLLDPDTGKTIRIDDWSPIAWSPDGTKLFVQRTGTAAGAPSELGVLEAADPQAVRSVGTIPYLEIYGGSWVRGEPTA